MAEYVESVEKHLLPVGLEGFLGPTSPPENLTVNLGESCSTIGSAFICNSKMRPLTFASVHIVLTNGDWKLNLMKTLEYISKWVTSLTLKMGIDS